MKAEADSNIAAMAKAIAALESGMAGSFIQSPAAQTLRQLVQSKADMIDADRQDVMSFLSGAQSADYAPQSGQIVGLLKQLKDSMSKDLADASAAEESAITSFNDLTAAKEKEIAASTTAIEEKTVRHGELGVAITEMTGDHADTVQSLADDKKFIADLEKNCATKQSEYDTIVKTRAEEQVALADTIKLLNDDDALELFKKTLPSASASFMQVQARESTLRERVLASIHTAQKKSGKPMRQLDFLVLALRGKKIGFDK